MTQLSLGLLAGSPKTFSDLASLWLSHQHFRVEQTRYFYEKKARALSIQVGAVLVERCAGESGARIFSEMAARLAARGRSPKEVWHLVQVAGRILRWAKDMGFVQRVPKMPVVRVPISAGKSRWFTEAQFAALLGAVLPNLQKAAARGEIAARKSLLETQCWLAWCYYTAARNVDCDSVVLDRSVSLVHGTYSIQFSKTRAAAAHFEPEWIPLPPALLALLQDLARTPPIAVSGERMWSPQSHGIDMVIRRACKSLGVPPASPNDLRRSFATVHAAAGVPDYVTARKMGHLGERMVRQVYRQVPRAALAAPVFANSAPNSANLIAVDFAGLGKEAKKT